MGIDGGGIAGYGIAGVDALPSAGMASPTSTA
jgi:hypothetical protein